MTEIQKDRTIGRINRASLLAFALLSGMILSVPAARASDGGGFLCAMVEQINGGPLGVVDTYFTADSPVLAYVACFGDAVGGMQTNIVRAVSKMSIGIGSAFVIFYGGMGVVFSIDRSGDPKECVLDGIRRFFLGMACMILAVAAVDMAAMAGVEMVRSVAEAIDLPEPGDVTEMKLAYFTGDDTGRSDADVEAGMDILEWIKTAIILMVPWIASLLATLTAYFVVFSILFEIGIRRAFMPVAIANVFEDGLRSPGVRYLKRYLAAFTKIAICVFVSRLGPVMESVLAFFGMDPEASMASALSYVFLEVVISFTMLGIMTKTGEYANDIIGV